MNAERWRAVLIAGLIFVLGGAAGAALTVSVGKRMLRDSLRPHPGTPTLAEKMLGRFTRDVADDLKLTSTEEAALMEELRASNRAFRQARLRYLRDLGLELRQLKERMAVRLPPEKRAGFEELTARRFDRLGVGDAP